MNVTSPLHSSSHQQLHSLCRGGSSLPSLQRHLRERILQACKIPELQLPIHADRDNLGARVPVVPRRAGGEASNACMVDGCDRCAFRSSIRVVAQRRRTLELLESCSSSGAGALANDLRRLIELLLLHPSLPLLRVHSRVAIMPGRQHSIVGEEHHAQVREARAPDTLKLLLLRYDTLLDGKEANGGIMGNEGDGIKSRGEANVVDPRVRLDLADHLPDLLEAHVWPEQLRRFVVHPLHCCREEADGTIHGPSRQVRVGLVPAHAAHRRVEVFNQLAHPPVVFLLIVAHGDALLPAADCKLLAIPRPLAVSGGSVYSEVHQSRVPLVVLAKVPHVRVPVLRARQQVV
mmetsp:Transcript_9241/g.30855  ORF Transcript_9241/g.30855 Transcript_9241/m.30855 type:complete len:347 (+) Transcript_9241:105-1145(+)